MYLPQHFTVDDLDHIEAFIADRGAADLVSVDAAGQPLATLMPCIWDRSTGASGTLYMHMSRANPQWKSIVEGSRGLAIVHGAQAYISPSTYPTKSDTGKVVPTWNYTSVHMSGTLSVSEDVDYLLDVVTRLTEAHEARQLVPWQVSDAPADYIAAQLRAIIAVTMHVDLVEAKAKLGQNRTDADRHGAAEALRASPDDETRTVGRLMTGTTNPLVD